MKSVRHFSERFPAARAKTARVKTALILAVIFLLAACANSGDAENRPMTNFKELDGKVLATATSNASYEKDFNRMFPHSPTRYFTNYFDTFIAVLNGEVGGAFTFASLEKPLQESYPNLYCLSTDMEIPVVAAFSATAKKELLDDFNAFVDSAKTDGTIQTLEAKWIKGYPNEYFVDFEKLTGEKAFKLATSVLNAPHEYINKGKLVGFEVELVYEFCRRYGYKPKIETPDYDAVLAGLSTGKYDVGFGAFGYTEERSESMIFSKPFYTDHVGFMVLDYSKVHSEPILQALKDSFYKNFVKENRWLLLLQGLGVTLLITLLSVLFGTIFGLCLFLFGRKNKTLDSVLFFAHETLESLPVLVILMVFYYVIFGKSDISGVWVSVIVFGMMFTLATYHAIKLGVSAVPAGQMEAGLALGYRESQSFAKIVFPQAAEVFMPVYKSNIVAYLKATAIVGYVAVTDLTKAGDIIRSRTFEAVFPLLAVALIYYVVARILIRLLNKIRYGKKERPARMKG